MTNDETKSAPEPAERLRRFACLDVARGVALIAMAIFHTGWDLSFLNLFGVDLSSSTLWMGFARVIATTFLFIAGVSLVLATRSRIVWPAFARRLAIIMVAALAVTLGTRLAIGEAFVAFGILHHLALASLIGLAFLRLPLAIVAMAALIALLLPLFIMLPGTGYGGGYFLGLAPDAPASVDYVPLFPWLSAGLSGILAARLGLYLSPAGWWTRWQADRPPFRLLATMGRWSLAIYLLHQPLIFGALTLVSSLQPQPASRAIEPAVQRFHHECRRACSDFGRTANYCASACTCTQASLERNGLWQQTLDNRLTSEASSRVQELARACAPLP